MANLLSTRPTLLFDGAMGTYFAELNRTTGMKCEMANLTAPEAIARIHREYIAAGAEAIKTNTFAANTAVLGCDLATVMEIIERGWRIACEAAEGHALVFADIGPMPEGDAEAAAAEYRAIADRFLALGARNFLFETHGGYEQVVAAAEYVKGRAADAYIIASFAVNPDGYTRTGLSGAQLGRAMNGCGAVDAWGFNCVSGPSYLLDYVKGLDRGGKPMSVMPNAGYPALQDGRTIYWNSPDYYARKMADLQALGVRILGGCCGTTPAHIARTAELLRRGAATGGGEGARGPRQAAGAAAPNRFWEKLAAGRKAIAVEADPPTDTGIAPLLEGVARLRDAGADIITVADSPLARARMDSTMTAALLSRRCGVEALPHLACRDRNLNAMKALLLGMHIEGIRNVLAVTGDPVPAADRTEVKGVFDFNSQMLAGYISELNGSVFLGDGLRIGAALNINAANLEAELRRARRKMERGVEFFLTQPVFGPAAVEALRRAREELGGCKLLAGILPLVSYRNALFIHNEVPGISIPEEVLERFRGLKRAEAERLGVELAASVAADVAPWADGYYIITPLGRYHVVCELIGRIGRESHD